MRIELVVAMAENCVIGRNNTLPWHIPADLQFFKTVTMGRPMIMGRKTFEAIGRALPGRDSIILSRATDIPAEGTIRAGSLAEALDRAEACARARGTDRIMVIGGAQVFAETLPLAAVIHLTRIHAIYEGDTFFPDYDESPWRETAREAHPAGEDGPAFTFLRLERTR